MGTVVLDASCVIAFLEAENVQHDRAVHELRPWLGAEHIRLVAASGYAEILVGPLRKGVGASVEGFLDAAHISIVPIDEEVARRAASLRAEHPFLRLPDAFPFALAQLRNAPLLTLDTRLARLAESD